MAMESWGRMGKASMKLLGDLAKVAPHGLHRDGKGDFVDRALRGLSIALCRGNATIFRASLTIFARATGNSFLAGDPGP